MATAPTISATGIAAPTYADVLDYLQTQYRGIFGQDIYLGNDSQDGQFLAIVATAINDSNAAAVACYNALSPATAQGNGLASVVKINGIKKNSATYSTADLLLVGVAGTTISNGIVSDANSNDWVLPASVVIPSGGSVTVTATCKTSGAVAALVGTITKIKTPAYGWQTATNPAAATKGAAVESDAALRVRQAASVAIPSLTVLEGIAGAVGAVSGVTQARCYENDTNSADANGLPAHSIAVVVAGGDSTAIASAISAKKTPGAYTHGTTSVSVTDKIGTGHSIRFFRPTDAPVSVAISIKALAGYTSAVGDAIKQSVAAYINGTAIGGGVAGCVEWDYAITAAKSAGSTFKISSLSMTGLHGAGSPDVSVLFNEQASCLIANITLTVS